jgi:hypothetical protein
MASPLARVDFDSDVTRGVVTGLAFLVALALNLDPERRTLALAVFGGGALAFFGLAFLATKDESYGIPKLRWYLFAAWGVLLFAVGLSTENTIGVVLGLVVAVYAAVRGWLFDAVAAYEARTGGSDDDLDDGSGDAGRDSSDDGADDEVDDDGPGVGADGWPEDDQEEWTGDALPPHLQPDEGDDSGR